MIDNWHPVQALFTEPSGVKLNFQLKEKTTRGM